MQAKNAPEERVVDLKRVAYFYPQCLKKAFFISGLGSFTSQQVAFFTSTLKR